MIKTKFVVERSVHISQDQVFCEALTVWESQESVKYLRKHGEIVDVVKFRVAGVFDSDEYVITWKLPEDKETLYYLKY